MKKFLMFLCAILLVFEMAATAKATPYAWTDELDFNPEYIGWYASYTYIHDITDDSPVPFVVGEDLVYNYSLSVSLYDDDLGLDELRGTILEFELAFIDQPGTLVDAYYVFSLANGIYGCSIAGVLSLDLLGKLWVTVDSDWGDFYLASSTLTAYGENIPEPATMLLLGSGLVGLAGFRRKFKK